MVARFVFIALALASCVSFAFGASRQSSGPSATIICYHAVESPADIRFSITRETFKQQMQYLAASGFNVISLADLQAYVAGQKESIPPNAVVITVDDGWRCTFTEVYPELKQFRFPFTVFLYPKFIGQGSYALTWKQIKEMADDGVDIQSHTFSHPFLTHRKQARFGERDYETWLQNELTSSKRIIEQEIGRPVSFLAYPYGDYDTRVALASAAAGYDAAVTCDYGRVAKGSDPLRMKRIIIDNTTTFASFRRALGVGQMMLTKEMPTQGKKFDPERPIVSARLPEFLSLDPASVGIAVISMGPTPYSYDPRNGNISLIIREPLKDNLQRVVVWGNRKDGGKRVEASWSFYLTQPPPNAVSPPTLARRPLPQKGIVTSQTVPPPAPAGEIPVPRPAGMRQPR